MRGRNKKICKGIIEYPVTIWMMVSLIILLSMCIAYAAYNGTADVKRVVSTQATSKTVFSSNYMEVYSSTNLAVKNLRTTNEGNFICSVTVCNYDQLTPTSPAHGRIDYSFKAELVEFNSSTGRYEPVTAVQMNGDTQKVFYVQKSINDNQQIKNVEQHSLNTAEGNFSYTYTDEWLMGENSYKDSFDICFDAAEVEKDVPTLFIRVTATPTENSVQRNKGISTLSSVISISQGRSVETGWHGRLQETGNVDYDGYNLIIEGSGVGKIDILWNNNKFAMNPVFITLYGEILSDAVDVENQTGWKKRTLTVNSMKDNRYIVQFYKKEPNAASNGNILCNNYIETGVAEETNP